ncbi:MAG: hypothetical protein IJA81_11015 [Akkermansia sp.]|nr:hypothetical protein [Akkermansia sp.]
MADISPLFDEKNKKDCIQAYIDIQEINQFYGTDYASKDDLLDDAVILHLAGTPNVRPWQVINGVYGAVWQYYYDLSPLRHVHIERPDIFCPPMKKEQLTMKSEIALLKKDSSIRAKEYNSFKENKENMVLINLYTRILYRYRLLQFKHFLSWGKRRVRYAKQKRHLKSLLQKARAARKIFFQVLMETSGI